MKACSVHGHLSGVPAALQVFLTRFGLQEMMGELRQFDYRSHEFGVKSPTEDIKICIKRCKRVHSSVHESFALVMTTCLKDSLRLCVSQEGAIRTVKVAHELTAKSGKT